MATFDDAQTDAADLASLVNGSGEVTTRYGDNPKKSWGLIQQEADTQIDRLQNLSSAARYGSIQDGIDNTLDGDYFDVISPSGSGFVDAYKNNSGVGEYLKTYPSDELITSINSKVINSGYESLILDDFEGFDTTSQTITNLTDGAAFSGSVSISDGMVIDQNISGRDFVFSTGRVNSAEKLRLRQEIAINTISGTCNLGLYLKSDTGSQVIYYGSNGWFVYTGASAVTGLPTFTAGDSIYLDYTFDSEKNTISILVGKVGDEEFSFVIDGYEQPEIWILQRGNVNATHSFKVESASSLTSSGASSFDLSASTVSDLSALNNMLEVCQREVPAGFVGAPSDYHFYEIGSKYFANVNLTNPLSEDESIVWHVDIATGDDTNSGSAESPFKSFSAAFDMITTDADTIVKVKGGTYPVDEGWRGRNRPAAKLAVVSWDGEPVVTSLHENGLSWSVESGTTYQATYTESISTVFDSSVLSADGDYLAVTKVDDLVTCNATANSYYNDTASSALYVNLTDGRAPDSDVRAYRFETFLNNAGGYNVPGGLIYIENIHFEGGKLGGFLIKNAEGDNKITYLAKNCSFKYSGADAFDVDGYVFGIAQNCVCAWAGDDGFNYHVLTNASPLQVEPNVVIEVGCIGRWNGRDTEGTNNGSTMHDAGVVIRVNGNYHDNQDRNVHDITNSYTWNLGCSASNSQTGNANFTCGIGDNDESKMWLDGCKSSGSPSDIEANGLLTNVYTYNFIGEAANNIGNGTISAYEAD